jgi:hypothetical protein
MVLPGDHKFPEIELRLGDKADFRLGGRWIGFIDQAMNQFNGIFEHRPSFHHPGRAPELPPLANLS